MDYEPQKKQTGCRPIVITIIVLLSIGFVCDHVHEEVQKLDTFTDLVLGTTILGLICLCYYLYSKGK